MRVLVAALAIALSATASFPAVDCDAVPAGGSWISLECRLGSLLAEIDAATELGTLRAKVRARVAKAADRRVRAAAACAQPKLGRARKGLGQAMKAVKQAGKTLRGRRVAAAVPGELRDRLSATLDGLATDLRALRAAAACPNDDADGDGSTGRDGDCDDQDPRVLPGAVEMCNGLDDDCDEAVDPGETCVVQVLPDVARAVTVVVGAAGGQVVAVAADGTTLTLAVPAGALAGDTSITLTPVASIVNMPFGGGVLVAVHFAPEGLVFAVPSTLTIGLPAAFDPADVVGFTYAGSGADLHLAPVAVNGTTAVLGVEHFSGAGVAVVSLEDFERFVREFIDAPGTPSLAEILDVLNDMVTWDLSHESPFCGVSLLCDPLLDKIGASMVNLLAGVCSEGLARLSEGNLAAARGTLTELLGVLTAFDGLAQPPPTSGFECAQSLLGGIIDAAGERAFDEPDGPVFLLLTQLASDADLMGLPALVNRAQEKIVAALRELLRLARELCETDVESGEALLTRRNVFTDPFLIGLDATLVRNFEIARGGCGFAVDPASVRVTFEDEVQFRALLRGVETGNVIWELSPMGGGIITPLGLYTAGSVSGTYTVHATSIDTPGKFALATVVVDAAQVTVDPGCVALAPNETQQFTATVTGPDDQRVTWTATGGTVDATGLYTAGAAEGTFEVRAASVVEPDAAATATVVILDTGAGFRAAEACVTTTTTTSTTSTTLQAAGVRLLQYGPAQLRVFAAALSVSDPQYTSCDDVEPADPEAPPPAIDAVCSAQATDEFGSPGTAKATASLAVSSTSAGVDGMGNPLISGLVVTASTDSSAAGQGSASTSAGVYATFELSASAGTLIDADVTVVGPMSNDDPCETTPIPAAFDGSGMLTLVVFCPEDQTGASFNFPEPEISIRSIGVTLTFASP